MRKVFKSIIDELKKAARSELKIYGGVRANGKSILLGYQKGLEDAVYIVNQVSKEYNNGWIPCSDRMPNCNGVYQITRKIAEGEYNFYISDSAYFDGQDTWHSDNRVNHGRPYLKDVIAWQPLSEPYKKGE